MILYAVLVGMALLAVLGILIPLLRPPAPLRPRAEHDAEIYRDQLAELERDRARGLVGDSQLEASRAEIGRRLLAAADAASDHPPEQRAAPKARAILAIGLAAALPLGAGGIYVWQGTPTTPDAASAATPPAERGGDLAALVERLAERMKERPDDPQGFRLLGRSLATLERYSEAAHAYGRAAALLPADAELKSLQGEALAAANRGAVTPEAERLFAAALRIDPGEPRSLFYLGLAALQQGDREGALARWQALAAVSPAGADWLPMLRRRIADLAPGTARPEPPGPTPEDIAAAQQMPAADRARMIRSMVEGLAARLKEDSDDAEGWARLARSWRVLGEPEKERAALTALARLLPEGSPRRAEVERRLRTLRTPR